MNKEQAWEVLDTINVLCYSLEDSYKGEAMKHREAGDEQSAKKRDILAAEVYQLWLKAESEYDNGKYENLGRYLNQIMNLDDKQQAESYGRILRS